jgi:hypothetical protein
MKRRPSFIKEVFIEPVREIIIQALRQADRYALSNFGRLDFFYFYEDTRRRNSGSLSAQTNLLITPFLNPDFIRAVFASSQHPRDPELFHRYIVQRNTPDWATVPYESELAKPRQRPAPKSADVSKRENTTEAEHNKQRGSRYYNSFTYWQTIGQPLIREALASDGFWQEIFDPQLAKQDWINAPDELAILYLLPGALC